MKAERVIIDRITLSWQGRRPITETGEEPQKPQEELTQEARESDSLKI